MHLDDNVVITERSCGNCLLMSIFAMYDTEGVRVREKITEKECVEEKERKKMRKTVREVTRVRKGKKRKKGRKERRREGRAGVRDRGI